MALEQPRGALGKISVVFATKLKSFSFMPVLKRIPEEQRIKPVWEKGLGKLSESTAKSAVAPEPTTAVTDAEISCSSPKPNAGADDLRHATAADINPELILNSESQREEDVLSPVSSVDIFTSPFSSKESILSEGWEHETGWSAVRMLSPTVSVSPCSSVRSGAFTPSVLRIKCHKLAPASSLIQMPLTSSQTHSCNKHVTLPCPLSTRARHRPPPTHLSLLTAILRKGRLPVLSSALQRPYSPCWPISPVNMSSCMACSAASNIAPMVGLQAKSYASTCTVCTEPSCKTELKPTGLIAKTEPMLPKEQKKGGDLTDANFSNTYIARATILPTPDARSCLSSYTPLLPKSAHLSKQTHKDMDESTEPSLLFGTSPPKPPSLSPESKSIERNRHKSNGTSGISSSSDSKLMRIAHERSPTPDPIRNQQSPHCLDSAVTKYTAVSPEPEKIDSLSMVFQRPSSLRAAGFTHHSAKPSISPVFSPPRPDSRTSPSDHYTLSSSPATTFHHLSSSPSYSLCSSPTSSLRNVSPDHIDMGSKKPYKIKSTYKALAAIPTNTLLLEQQAVDDDVTKKDAPPDPSDSFAWEDPHSQMCSPAQLRQQSAELYQVIDEVLKDTKRAESSSTAKKLGVRSETTRKQTPSPLPRSLGRETKYAAVLHQPPDPTENTLTKPGVIRPAVVMSRLADKQKSRFLNLY